MGNDLFQKNVLITGAANGIGEFVVRHLVEEGVKFLKCDVSQEDQLFKTFEDALKDCGYIDVIINNAGLADDSSFPKIRKLVEVNFLAVVNLTLKALESMRKDHGGRGGTLLNISSIAALCKDCTTLFTYIGAKSAVLQFSNCIGKPEFYSKTGVRVLTICFGRTTTSIMDKALSFDEEFDKYISTVVHDKLVDQSPEHAARGVLETLKSGKTGSTWLSSNGKPAEDISESITKAYGIMTQTFT